MADEGFILPGLQMGKRDWEEAATNRARKVLDDVAGQAASAGVKCDTVHVFKDMPHTAIIDTAKKQGCDLIVMGSHGYGGFKQWVLGSETTRVLSQSKIPVLVYR
jgi:nucleotide-binding universal stress UspA family protein